MDHADLRSHPTLIEPLTGRELDVLRLLAEDLSIAAMAERLVLSPATVKWYTQQIYGKLGIHESGQKRRLAVARGRALGLLEAERTPARRPRYSLPVQTTPLVGRAREIRDITALLANPAVRLVTLLGPGGMGKTRLALEVGWRLVEPEAFGLSGALFPDGVYFVPLQPVESPDNILWAVAEAVGFPFQSDGRAPQRQLLDFFREKRLLLIMDNFEHLLDGADLVSAILQAAPGVQVLVTSRETLNLHAETVFSLEGLPFPGRVEDTPDYDAARLFVLGARRACADFALQPEDLPALAHICALVEGMPLAILLAAAWVEVLSLPEIAEEIARSFNFLTAEMRDAPRRQWSIRAVFEPTWQRLSAAEHSVFKRLSVFRGGCTRQAAQAVTGTSLPVLQALVNKAVLSRTPKGRYEIHELLRQFAQDRLKSLGEIEAARDAHCAHYADFMHARQDDLKGGDRQIAALDEIEADFENVRAAWEWAIEQKRTDDLKRMTWGVWRFLTIRGRFAEGLTLFGNALHLEENAGLSGPMMTRYAFFCAELGRLNESDEWSLKSLRAARKADDSNELALALRIRAAALTDLYGDFEHVHCLVDESLQLYRELGNTWGEAWGLQFKGLIASQEGRYLSALSLTEEALKRAQIVNDRHRMGAALLNIGAFYWCLGELQKALQHTEQSLGVVRKLCPALVTRAMSIIGGIAQCLGDFNQALDQYQGALKIAHELGFSPLIAELLQRMADLLSLTGKPEEAIQYLAVCDSTLASFESGHLKTGVLTGRSMIAYRTAHYDEALRYAQQAQEYAHAHAHPSLEYLSWLVIGLVEIRLGRFAEARQHVLISLPRLQIKYRIMRAIYALAALEAADGRTERAVELAALVQHHQAAEYEFKVYAGNLLAELQAALPPDIYAAAVERGAALDPDAVVAAFLSQGDS